MLSQLFTFAFTVTGGHIGGTEQKATTIMKERYSYKSELQKALVQYTKNTCFFYSKLGLKGCTEKVSSSLQGNKKTKSRSSLRYLCMTLGRELNLNGLPYG